MPVIIYPHFNCFDWNTLFDTQGSKTNQELRQLLNVNDFFKKIVIVRKDIKPYSNEQGITIIGIRHFLLNNNSLEF